MRSLLLDRSGTFDSQEEAAVANEIGRNILFCDGLCDVQIGEVDERVKLAREAAQNAVSSLFGASGSTPAKAGNTASKRKTKGNDRAKAEKMTKIPQTKENERPASQPLTCHEASGSVNSAATATVSSSRTAEPVAAAQVDDNSKATIDFRNVGVRQTRSGNWVRYHLCHAFHSLLQYCH
jgi:hypothetical protein